MAAVVRSGGRYVRNAPAGQPPVLPVAAGLRLQPADHADQAQPAALLAETIVQRERRRQRPRRRILCRRSIFMSSESVAWCASSPAACCAGDRPAERPVDISMVNGYILDNR